MTVGYSSPVYRYTVVKEAEVKALPRQASVVLRACMSAGITPETGLDEFQDKSLGQGSLSTINTMTKIRVRNKI